MVILIMLIGWIIIIYKVVVPCMIVAAIVLNILWVVYLIRYNKNGKKRKTRIAWEVMLAVEVALVCVVVCFVGYFELLPLFYG